MTASQDEGSSAEFDTILEACCHPVRRVALATLLGQPGPIALSELAEPMETNAASVTGDGQENSPNDDDPDRSMLLLTLHHTHLPKLVEAGLVEYDPARAVAEPTAEFDRVRPLMSTIVTLDPALETPIVG